MDKFILHPSFGSVMRKIVSALAPWKWCLIGGRAVEIWTNPPQTPDIDVLIALDDEGDMAQVVDRMKLARLRPETPIDFDDPMAKFLALGYNVEVDVLVAHDPLHFQVIDRAARKTVKAVRFPVAYAEDIVILKSQALVDPGRRPDKKQRDRQAIRDIARSVTLDKTYIRETLDSHRWIEEAKMLRLMRVV
jgi:hypothetical protein